MRNKEIKEYIKVFKTIKGKKNLTFEETNNIIDRLDKLKDSPKLISNDLLLDVYINKKKKNIVVKKLISIFKNKLVTSYEVIKDNIDSSKDQYYISRLKSNKVRKIHQTLEQSIKSITVITLLREYMNKTIDDDLLESLDFASLVRLSLIKGGETITIPTYDEVEKTIVDVYYSYLLIFENLTHEGAVKKLEEELDVKYSKKELKQGYEKVSIIFSNEIKKESSSINDMFGNLLSIVKRLQKKLENSIDNVNSNESFFKMYNDINKAFLKLTRALSSVGGLRK